MQRRAVNEPLGIWVGPRPAQDAPRRGPVFVAANNAQNSMGTAKNPPPPLHGPTFMRNGSHPNQPPPLNWGFDNIGEK